MVRAAEGRGLKTMAGEWELFSAYIHVPNVAANGHTVLRDWKRRNIWKLCAVGKSHRKIHTVGDGCGKK